ncbi:MAG TPA: hypothetical protein VGG27_21205 [Magnetospirillaceae bacterium]|jgi:hypothetical protein
MRTPYKYIAAAVLSFGLAVPVAAQTPEITRVRGTIDTVTPDMVAIKTRDGSLMKVNLGKQLVVGTVKKANLADIKPGTFVGSAAVKGADGKLHALEVHIFAESQRGTGEGQRGWDAGPDSSMTNATVGEVTATPNNGHSLRLSYKDGKATIEVAADTPIVAFAPGDPSLLVKGHAIIAFAMTQADGTLAANRVIVESRDGVKPPM